MVLFNKPLSAYYQDVKIGVYLILALTVIRFLMQPVFGVPIESGTMITSTTILFLIVWLYYTIMAIRNAETSYNDLLGISFMLALCSQAFTTAAILLDDLAGIQTYFTASQHGGDINTYAHAGSHLVIATIVFAVVMWGIGSLIKVAAGKKSESKPA